MIGRVVVISLAGAALASMAVAQEPGSPQTRGFIHAAGEIDTFETMAAYTALAESRDPQVLDFARQVLRDHAATSRALREATMRAGLAPPPMAIGAGQSPFLAALQSLRGGAFDLAYWRQQLLVHRAALAAEQIYADTGDNPAVRQAAVAAIPLIQSHLAVAERMTATPSN